jgi:pantoate--beta-alanine ligase
MERNLCVAIRSPACNGQNQEYSIRNDKLIVNHKGVTNAPRLCRVGNTMSRRPARSKSRRPQIIHSLPTLTRTIAQWRRRRERIGLIPTMGALHAGHLALVKRAQRRADRVIVSIFVNPTQFAPTEDLKTYPRTFAADVEALARVGADLIWAPSAETMYPQGFATRVVPAGPAAVGLEDAFRPHFFSGVTTVVAKLFVQCDADIAVFGEKDYQQLKVVTQMARDLDLKTRIVALPTVREKDGLALSSRNAYLSAEERVAAPTLHRVLVDCAEKIATDHPIAAVLSEGKAVLAQAGFAVDYLEARNADTLAPVQSATEGPLRLLVAARLGKTRLIDNIAV